MNPMRMLRDMRTIRQLLERAESVAREMGEEQPGAEHLLVSAMELPDGAAGRILARFDVDAGRLRAAIEETHAEALASVGIDTSSLGRAPALEPPAGSGLYRSRPSAQEAFGSAGALARAAKERLSGAHVVAAVAAIEHGTVARTLDRLGLERAALVAASDAERAAGV